MKLLSFVLLLTLYLTGCAEGNLGYGFGHGSGSAGHNNDVVLKSNKIKIYQFKSPVNTGAVWRQPTSFFDFQSSYDEGYYISQNWVALSNAFTRTPRKLRDVDPIGQGLTAFPDAHLLGYLNALTGKVSLEKAHTAYFSAFYPNSTILSQEQKSVKGINCMQTKAIYNKEYLVELQCPVFFRNTFGTITYLMHTMGGGNTVDLIDQNIPAFNHMVDTLEFIEPPSQKIPDGFSLDEQFKRIQEPNWKL
ncbi:MAG: hypothetical protein Q7S87_11010 [Agitococcus sp.]|nr:hypothetical protein [Agitococcus sp.]